MGVAATCFCRPDALKDNHRWRYVTSNVFSLLLIITIQVAYCAINVSIC